MANGEMATEIDGFRIPHDVRPTAQERWTYRPPVRTLGSRARSRRPRTFARYAPSSSVCVPVRRPVHDPGSSAPEPVSRRTGSGVCAHRLGAQRRTSVSTIPRRRHLLRLCAECDPAAAIIDFGAASGVVARQEDPSLRAARRRVGSCGCLARQPRKRPTASAQVDIHRPLCCGPPAFSKHPTGPGNHCGATQDPRRGPDRSRVKLRAPRGTSAPDMRSPIS